jgi:hypothetical protein
MVAWVLIGIALIAALLIWLAWIIWLGLNA